MTVSTWTHGARVVRAHPVLFAAAFGLYLTFYTLPLAIGLLTKSVFDALSGHALWGWNVWSLIALLVGVEIARLTVIFFASWSFNLFNYRMERLLRGNMLGWLMTAPGAQILPSSAGEAMTRFREDIAEFNSFMEVWIDLSGQTVFAVAAFAIMLCINPGVTVLAIAPMIAIATLTHRLTSRIQEYRRLSREATGGVTGYIAEVFGAAQAVQLAGAERLVVARLDELNDHRRHTAMRDQVFSATMEAFSANTAGIGLGIILLLTASAMRGGAFTVGDFSLFTAFIGWAAAAPRWVGRLLTRQRQADVSIKRMGEVMPDAPALALSRRWTSAQEREPDTPTPLSLLSVKGLSYRHPGSGRGIEDIEFSVRRGSFTVVTGRVGAGKTTLLRALLGLVPATRTEFLWNDEPINDPSSFMIPPRCAYAPQTPRLFSESLRDNILMGRSLKEEALQAVLYGAALEEDVTQLAQGLDTMIGNRGAALSGGQVQRAASARMLSASPDLLVVDDPSSALDVRTEEAFWGRLLDAPNRPTYIAVSHRPSALCRADEIIFLEDGRAVARGPLPELLEKCAGLREIYGRE